MFGFCKTAVAKIYAGCALFFAKKMHKINVK